MTERTKHDTPLAEAREVSKLFPARAGLRAGGGRSRYVRAVDRVSLSVNHAETLGLVGESGCGKSTLGRLLIRLETPTAGSVLFDGRDITKLRGGKLRRIRREMQIIFQDPASSLNPRYTVRETLTEAIRAHRGRPSSRRLNAHLAALLDMVGLPLSSLDRLPREFSGGERQRISIARALAVEPRFIVADEPVSSLDLTAQAQIIDLIANLRRELNVAFLLIAHNLEIVRHLCNRVAVMYLGRIVELSDTSKLFVSPRHPYTRALMASALSPNPDDDRRINVLPGDPPSPLEPPKGCHFHPRCPHSEMQCRLLQPELREPAPGHFTKCHFDFTPGEAKSIPPIGAWDSPQEGDEQGDEAGEQDQEPG
ncbi:MAG: ABC transporter ATP-binding protein [Deltaproteobacteria bacterium]|nr:ABC transporter ATP-binding protein [Deltaproteobacteria bacterium]